MSFRKLQPKIKVQKEVKITKDNISFLFIWWWWDTSRKSSLLLLRRCWEITLERILLRFWMLASCYFDYLLTKSKQTRVSKNGKNYWSDSSPNNFCHRYTVCQRFIFGPKIVNFHFVNKIDYFSRVNKRMSYRY